MKYKITKCLLCLLLLLPLFNIVAYAEEDGIKVILTDDDLKANKQETSFSFTPGDEFVQVITWKNDSSNKHRLYFKCISDNEKILEVMNLKITYNDELLFQGKANKVMESWNLGEFVPNQDENFVITLSLPKEVNNDYSMEKANIKLVLSNEVIPEKINDIEVPKTGVHFPYELCLVFGISLFGIMILMSRRDNNVVEDKE